MSEKMTTAPWIKIKSSNIVAYAYDEATQTLSIEFISGIRYDYHGVDKGVVEQFQEAPSKGGFFAEDIRNKFKSVRRQDQA